VSIPQWQPAAGASTAARQRWQREMREWIGQVLDWRTETKIESANEYWGRQGSKKHFERSAIEDARQGNVEPLRKIYPHIAEFIHSPREGRRGKYSRWRGVTAIDAAVEAAAFVRLFWREVYGRKNRGRDDLSADSIVADYYKSMGHAEVTEDAIMTRAKTYRMPLMVAKQDAELAHAFAEKAMRCTGQ
jgi:hypothetical protein